MRESPPLMKAIEYLADGEWHDMATVIAAVMDQVEPSKAFRRCESMRQYGLEKRGKDPKQARQRQIPKWMRQQVGARSIARETVMKSPRFELQWLAENGEWVDNFRLAPRLARVRVRSRPGYVYGARTDKRQPELNTADDLESQSA